MKTWSEPPSEPNTKLGRKITCSRPEPCTACSMSHFAAVVRRQLLRLLADAERAHQHEAADTRVARRGDQVARALRHHALEVGGLAEDDRDEVDDRVAALHRPAEARRVGDVALDELDAPAPRPAAGVRTSARTSFPAARSAWTIFGPTKPVPPVTRITAGSFSSSGSASGPAGPGTSSRARRCRRGLPPARRAGRTRAGRSSSRGRS